MDTLPSSSVFVDMELSVDESPEDYNSVIGSISVPAGSGWAAWREAAAQAQADLDDFVKLEQQVQRLDSFDRSSSSSIPINNRDVGKMLGAAPAGGSSAQDPMSLVGIEFNDEEEWDAPPKSAPSSSLAWASEGDESDAPAPPSASVREEAQFMREEAQFMQRRPAGDPIAAPTSQLVSSMFRSTREMPSSAPQSAEEEEDDGSDDRRRGSRRDKHSRKHNKHEKKGKHGRKHSSRRRRSVSPSSSSSSSFGGAEGEDTGRVDVRSSQSSLRTDRVAALEAQVASLQQELARVQAEAGRARSQQEQAFAAEKTRFDAWKVAELDKFEAWKSSETEKLRNEKRALAKQAKLLEVQAVQEKTDRSELEGLKATLTKLKLDYQTKESKLQGTINRQQQTIEDLNDKVDALEGELTGYEEEVLALKGQLKAALTSPPTLAPPSLARAGSGAAVVKYPSASKQPGAEGTTRIPIHTSKYSAARTGSADSGRGTAASDAPKSSSSSNEGGYTGKASYGSDDGYAPTSSTSGGDGYVPPKTGNGTTAKGYFSSEGYAPQRGSSGYGDDGYAQKAPSAASDGYAQRTPIVSDVYAQKPPGVSDGYSRKGATSADTYAQKGPITGDLFPSGRSSGSTAPPPAAVSGGSDAQVPVRDVMYAPAPRFTGERGDSSGRGGRRPSDGSESSSSALSIEPPPGTVPEAPLLQERQLGDGKVERRYGDGRRVVTFRNGTEKELTPDGRTIVRFVNGDIKESDPSNGHVVYFYAEARTKHTTLPDGTEMFDFPSGQHETHFPGGSKEILFPDGTIKTVTPDGIHQSVFPDGTSMIEYPDGRKEVSDPPQK